MIKEELLWVCRKLEAWRETYQDEDTPKLDKLISKLRNGELITRDDYQEIVFHLWQISHNEEE